MPLARPLLISMALTLAAGLLLVPEATTAQQTKARMKKGARAKAKEKAKARADAAGKAEVRLMELSIRKPEPRPERGDAPLFQALSGPETQLTVRVHLPGRTIVGLDEAASTLTEFVDDTGTNLLAPEAERPRFGDTPTVSGMVQGDDTATLTVNLLGARSPAPGAVKIAVKGDLVVRCAGGEETVERKDVALKDGTKLAAGPLTLTIEDVDPEPFANVRLRFGLSSDRPIDGTIKELAFLDPAGEPIESQLFSKSSSMTPGGKGHYLHYYGLMRKVDAATVKVTYYDNVADVHVPVDINTGVGF